ncbi:hypothetical protein D5085_13055 [Ectothiorhodospiraceae bacterium BW-2]|nr:hypothetical protein D5085_13055 [Ectothiorhodospiraceae bacterium BW-2]
MLLDITHARLMHLDWEMELEAMLSGRKRLKSVCGWHECILGQWLYQEGIPRYGSISHVVTLEQEHKKFHELAQQVVKYYQSGHGERAAELFKEVQRLSKEIIFLLTVIERQVVKRRQMSYMVRHPLKSLQRVFRRH